MAIINAYLVYKNDQVAGMDLLPSAKSQSKFICRFHAAALRNNTFLEESGSFHGQSLRYIELQRIHVMFEWN